MSENQEGRIFREPTKRKKEEDLLGGDILETKNFKRCLQMNCPYFKKGGCQPCEECGTVPYILKKNCYRCMACANICNSKRWTDSTEDKRMKEIERTIKNISEASTRRSSESKVMHIPDSGLIEFYID